MILLQSFRFQQNRVPSGWLTVWMHRWMISLNCAVWSIKNGTVTVTSRINLIYFIILLSNLFVNLLSIILSFQSLSFISCPPASTPQLFHLTIPLISASGYSISRPLPHTVCQIVSSIFVRVPALSVFACYQKYMKSDHLPVPWFSNFPLPQLACLSTSRLPECSLPPVWCCCFLVLTVFVLTSDHQ